MTNLTLLITLEWNPETAAPPPEIRLNLKNYGAWIDLLIIANEMSVGTFLPDGNWDHYYNPELCTPSWARDLVDVTEIGRHRFGRMKP
jgi:hypothetical protein